jgi:hypothetical protein
MLSSARSQGHSAAYAANQFRCEQPCLQTHPYLLSGESFDPHQAVQWVFGHVRRHANLRCEAHAAVLAHRKSLLGARAGHADVS